MTRPTEVIEWANGTPSGDVGPALTVASIAYFSLGEVDLIFSGTPDLSAINPGHMLAVEGAAFDVNNGSFVITQVDPVAYRIRVRNMTRYSTTTAEDEPASPAAAQAQDGGPNLADIPAAKQATGYFDNEYPAAAHFNRFFQNVSRWTKHLSTILPVGYELLQARLTQGDNISLTDNGDGTQRISAVISINTVEALGRTFTQASHGFAPKEQIRPTAGGWVKAQGNSIAGCTDTWLVTAVSGNDFTAYLRGRITLTGHGLTVGAVYYLSADTAGLLTATMPVGNTTRPLGYYLPVLYVESTSVVHLIGAAAPTFNRVYAERVATGNSSLNTAAFDFTNISADNVGGYITAECTVRSGSPTNNDWKIGVYGPSSTAELSILNDNDYTNRNYSAKVDIHRSARPSRLMISGYRMPDMAAPEGYVNFQTAYTFSGNVTQIKFFDNAGAYPVQVQAGDYARLLINQMPAA